MSGSGYCLQPVQHEPNFPPGHLTFTVRLQSENIFALSVHFLGLLKEADSVDLRSKESLVKKGPANLLRGVESVGGVLRVTSHRLIFDPHSGNLPSTHPA